MSFAVTSSQKQAKHLPPRSAPATGGGTATSSPSWARCASRARACGGAAGGAVAQAEPVRGLDAREPAAQAIASPPVAPATSPAACTAGGSPASAKCPCAPS